ncbi:hypothetical protein ABH926_002625 [Catenulispora sp. GP43]|uniref:hypothetical protein n=1 Tax=Catenulispora sp. GP43 TaxID=3156263 RepID=UPI003516C350
MSMTERGTSLSARIDCRPYTSARNASSARPLPYAAVDLVPFRRGDHPWHQVEREGSFLAPEGERHTAVGERPRHLLGSEAHLVGIEMFQRREHPLIGAPGVPGASNISSQA